MIMYKHIKLVTVKRGKGKFFIPAELFIFSLNIFMHANLIIYPTKKNAYDT